MKDAVSSSSAESKICCKYKKNANKFTSGLIPKEKV